jgi:hypothetical protein
VEVVGTGSRITVIVAVRPDVLSRATGDIPCHSFRTTALEAHQISFAIGIEIAVTFTFAQNCPFSVGHERKNRRPAVVDARQDLADAAFDLAQPRALLTHERPLAVGILIAVAFAQTVAIETLVVAGAEKVVVRGAAEAVIVATDSRSVAAGDSLCAAAFEASQEAFAISIVIAIPFTFAKGGGRAGS